MNILFVTPYFPPDTGGVATFADSLQRSLKERGHEVHVLTQGSSHEIVRRAGMANTDAYEFYMRTPWVPEARIKGLLAFLGYFIPSLLRLRSFIKEKRIDLIVIEYPMGFMFYFLFFKLLARLKIVVGIHGNDILSLHLSPKYEQWLVKRIIGQADWLLAHSSSLLSEAETLLGNLNGNKSALPYGVEIARLRALAGISADHFRLPPGPYILTVAKLRKHKGLDILLHAIKKLGAAATGYRFVIVGNGPEEEALKQLASRLGIEDAVVFTGELQLQAISKLYEDCEFFVLPSRLEPFGIVLLEAMVFGKAVVTANVGGIKEFVRDGDSGILVEPDNSDALAKQIGRLIEDRELRSRIGQNGRRLVEEKYDYDLIIREYESLLKSVHGSGQPTESIGEKKSPLIPEIGVLALVPDEWDVSWQPRHHVLTRLSSYFHVVWVNPAPEWRDMIGSWVKSMGRQTAEIAGAPGFVVYRSRFFPKLYRPKWLAKFFYRQRLKQVRRLLRLRGCKKIILYLWRPEFEKAIKLIPFDESCYHIDDEYSFSEVEVPPDPSEMRLIAAVDQVFIHSRGLLEKKGAINPRTVFVPNGCDYPAYSRPAAEPADLAGIPHPRVGYTGRIKRQLDWPLILQLTSQHPEWSFVFVGPVTEDLEVKYAVRKLSERPNVHFLGYKPTRQLAAYPQHFDVCVMPYRINDYTKYIYPLKLHEYLASGRPAVGSAVLSLREFSHVVSLARSPDEWSQAIRDCLAPAACAPARVEERRSVAREYDWNRLVGLIARALCEQLGSDSFEKIEKAAMGSSPATLSSTSTMTAHGAQPDVDNTAPEPSRYPGSHPIG